MEYMIALIIEIVVAIATRVYVEKNRKKQEKAHFEYIVFLLFSIMVLAIAYLVTDTVEGVVLVWLMFMSYGLTIRLTHSLHREPIHNIIIIFMIPSLYMLMVQATYFILASFPTLFLPMILIPLIMFGRWNLAEMNSFRSSIPICIGGLIVLILIFATSPYIDRGSIKEEVAVKFLEEELNMKVRHITNDHGFRGEEIEMMAESWIDSRYVRLLYKDKQIVDYQVRE